MKLRIKMKHFLLFIVACLIILPALVFIAIPQYQLYQIEKKAMNGEGVDMEKLTDLLNRPMMGSSKVQVIHEYVAPKLVHLEHDVIISPRMSYSNVIGNRKFYSFSDEEEYEYLSYYVKNWSFFDEVFKAALEKTAVLYDEKDGLQAVQQLFQEAKENQRHPDGKRQVLVVELDFYMKNRQVELAQEILNEINNQKDVEETSLIGIIAYYEALLLLENGEDARANEVVDLAVEQYQLDNHGGYWDKDIYDKLLTLKEGNEERVEAATVHGQVKRSDGEPLEKVAVFLIPQSKVNNSVHARIDDHVLTDEQGNYRFDDVKDGYYQMAVGLTFEQMQGFTWPVSTDEWIEVENGEMTQYDVVLKPFVHVLFPINEQEVRGNHVELQWEEVEGASYYEVSLGNQAGSGTFSQALIETKETNVTVYAEDLYARIHHGYSYDPIDAEERKQEEGEEDLPFEINKTVVPESLFGFAYPGNKLIWHVEAFDANGQILASTARLNGFYTEQDHVPAFYLKDRSLTDADKALLQGEIVTAYRLYEEDASRSETDIHSLNMLIKMHQVFDDEAGMIPWLEERVKRRPDSEAISSLLNHYATNQSWDMYEKMTIHYKDDIEKMEQTPHGISYVSRLVEQGEHEKALTLIKEMEHNHYDDKIVVYRILLEYVTGQSEEQLQRDVEGLHIMTDSSIEFRELQKTLENVISTDFNNSILLEGLTYFFKQDEPRLKQWLEQTTDESMADLFYHLQGAF